MIDQLREDTGRVGLAMLLIALGAIALMGTGLLWPLFILVPGLVMLGVALKTGETGAAAMSIPGAIITGTGALLFIQNLTGYFESWAYAWTLYPVFLGLAFRNMAAKSGDSSLNGIGAWFVRIGLGAFALFGFFFEFVIGLGGVTTGGAAVMIGAGVLLLFHALTNNPSLPPASKRKAKRKSKRTIRRELLADPEDYYLPEYSSGEEESASLV